MKSPRTASFRRPRSLLLPGAGILLTLGIFGAALYFITLQLREKIQGQIVSRDAEILHAVSALWSETGDEETAEESDPLSVILKTSRLKGVIAARWYDAEGDLIEPFPYYVTEASLDPANLPVLRQFRPVSRFHPRADLEEIFLLLDSEGEKDRFAPLLEVLLPLHSETSGELVGIGQFIIDGEGVAAEFAALDANLFRQTAIAFAVGAVVIVTGLVWAFRRLHRANRELAQQTDQLRRANQELALSARTAAVGSVTAHLIHGLKNPLAGLQNLVAARGMELPAMNAEEWQDAAAGLRRMQTLINEVVRVLREEEEGGAGYEITLPELAELVSAKIAPMARDKNVQFICAPTALGTVSNRVANLSALILANLLQNAIQATPSGACVEFRLRRDGESVLCEVRDEGSGIAPEVQRSLFAPVRSQKEGGSGIGLAISKQLAAHLGASLELTQTSPRGTVFTLCLPSALVSSEPQTTHALS